MEIEETDSIETPPRDLLAAQAIVNAIADGTHPESIMRYDLASPETREAVRRVLGSIPKTQTLIDTVRAAVNDGRLKAPEVAATEAKTTEAAEQLASALGFSGELTGNEEAESDEAPEGPPQTGEE